MRIVIIIYHYNELLIIIITIDTSINVITIIFCTFIFLYAEFNVMYTIDGV